MTIDDLGDGSGNQNVIVDPNGKLVATSLTSAYTLPTATSTSLGGVKIGSGSGLNVDVSGNLSVDQNSIVHPWTVEASGEAHRNSNVGIGNFTSAAPPIYPLDVMRTNSDGNSAYFEGNVIAYSNLLVGRGLGIGISNPQSELDIHTDTNNTAVYISNNTTSNGSTWGCEISDFR